LNNQPDVQYCRESFMLRLAKKRHCALTDLFITRLWPLFIMCKACVLLFWVHVTQRPLLGDVHHFGNFELESKTEQASFYAIMLLNCIWEVPNLNLCVTTVCSDGFFYLFLFLHSV